MKTTIQQQIKAVQLAMLIADNEIIRNFWYGIDFEALRDGLNDAGSTLAAINLNPDVFDKIASLESLLKEANELLTGAMKVPEVKGKMIYNAIQEFQKKKV